MAGQKKTAEFKLDDAAFLAALGPAIEALKVRSNRGLDALGKDIQNRARQYAPVKSGRLRNSIVAVSGDDERGHYVIIGTGVNYARPVEFGARPHKITAVNGKALHWKTTGASPFGKKKVTDSYFYASVNHPGNAAQPFMRPALLEAIAAWPSKFPKT